MVKPSFDFLSSPFSLVSVGLGVLAIAIIGIVVWILSIDRRTRGMVDSLEQERRKVAEMQVFLSRRGNDGARRAPRAPQSGAAVGARSAAASGEAPLPSQGAARGRSATPHSSQAAAVSDGQFRLWVRVPLARRPQTDMRDSRAMGRLLLVRPASPMPLRPKLPRRLRLCHIEESKKLRAAMALLPAPLFPLASRQRGRPTSRQPQGLVPGRGRRRPVRLPERPGGSKVLPSRKSSVAAVVVGP